MSNVGRFVTTAVVSYCIASFGSYKYGVITKAQSEVRDIKDKKKFLLETHDKIAEKYDSMYQKRDFSNKISKYRRTLLSYAEGDVLEMGSGTGANFSHYTSRVDKVLAVDWSKNMLMQAFGRITELQQDDKLKTKVDFLQADCSELDLQNESFDCVVDTFTLSSSFDQNANCREMIRVCKPGGYIILL